MHLKWINFSSFISKWNWMDLETAGSYQATFVARCIVSLYWSHSRSFNSCRRTWIYSWWIFPAIWISVYDFHSKLGHIYPWNVMCIILIKYLRFTRFCFVLERLAGVRARKYPIYCCIKSFQPFKYKTNLSSLQACDSFYRITLHGDYHAYIQVF